MKRRRIALSDTAGRSSTAPDAADTVDSANTAVVERTSSVTISSIPRRAAAVSASLEASAVSARTPAPRASARLLCSYHGCGLDAVRQCSGPAHGQLSHHAWPTDAYSAAAHAPSCTRGYCNAHASQLAPKSRCACWKVYDPTLFNDSRVFCPACSECPGVEVAVCELPDDSDEL